MSAHIGTNFSLQSGEFLDSRQGQALSKTDLLKWETPVPEGFEIYLDNEWYFYDSRINLPSTGHWIPRIYKGDGKLQENQSISAKYLKSLQDKVDDLEQIVRSLSIKFNLVHIKPIFDNIFKSKERLDKEKFELILVIGINIDQQQEHGNVEEDLFRFSDLNNDGRLDSKDSQELLNRFDRLDFISKDPNYYENAIIDEGIYEVGSQIFPSFKLSLEQDGEKIDSVKIDSYKVDSVGGVDFFVTLDKTNVYANGLLSSTEFTKEINIPVKAFLKTGQVVYDEITYKFLSNVYWGISSMNDLAGENLHSNTHNIDYVRLKQLGFSSKLSSNYNIESELNCITGKTPIIILPSAYSYSGLMPKIFINDTLMSDIWQENFSVRTSKGLDLPYTAYGIRNFVFDNPTVKLSVITEKRNGQ